MCGGGGGGGGGWASVFLFQKQTSSFQQYFSHTETMSGLLCAMEHVYG